MTGYDDFATGSFQRIKFTYRNIARYAMMWTFRKGLGQYLEEIW